MIGWTLCSGIGAPELAAPWIDWRLASEVEPFPRAVLAERFGYKAPDDHNQGDPLLWGDMAEVTPELARARGVPLPDLLVAGTPCQSFSIAGLRGGIEDARGNLTLKFVEICHAIVDARPDGKLAVLWENVPGVLSDKGNAFGNFMGGLVGSVDPLLPSPKPKTGKSTAFWKWVKAGTYEINDEDGEPTGKFETVAAHHRCTWPGEGMVQGPRARLSWCILDAQFFGVAQRRRRVFVVVDFGGSCDPAQILLEPESVRGNTPPRRKTGQGTSGFTASSFGGYREGTGTLKASGGDVGPGSETIAVSSAWPVEVAPALNASFGDKLGLEDQHDLNGAGLFVPVEAPLRSMGHMNSHTNGGGHAAVAVGGAISHALTSEGHDASEDGTGRGTPVVAFGFEDRSRGDDGRGYDRAPHFSEEISPTISTVKPPSVAGPTVRRLMPVECARLQGAPDNHTAITYRGKPAGDGAQYKAYGNSMAVPCIRWILERIRP